MRTSNRQNPFARPLAARRRPLAPQAALLVALAAGVGCNMLPAQPAAPRVDMKRVEEANATIVKALDDQDKFIEHVLQVALGKEDPGHTKLKGSAVELIAALRSKDFPLRLGSGKHSRRETLMLDRDDALLEYSAKHVNNEKGERRERAEATFKDLSKKLELLQMHFQDLNYAVETTNRGVIDFGLAVMVGTSEVYAKRREGGGELDDADFSNVARLIGHQRRIEAMSALVTGLRTAYHASVRDGKDPKVIEGYATETLRAIPTKGEATKDEAKAYLDSLFKDRDKAKEHYKRLTRELEGEEHFRSSEGNIDDKIAKVEANLKAAPSPSRPFSVAAPAGAVPSSILGQGQTLLNGANALKNGDYKGAVAAATQMVPDGPIKKGLSLISSFL